jgi:electron transport complex protein RnfB
MLDFIFPSISSIAAVTLLGAVFGLLLSIAIIKLRVVRDPRIDKVLEVLPGGDCGACGLPGCSAYATRIVEGKYRIDLCMVGGNETASRIARIMGNESPTAMIENIARIHCRGGTDYSKIRFIYGGLRECGAANGVMEGFKVCRYGCLGFGDCGRACPFGAIQMGGDGLPVVDYGLCTGCGLCVMACPRNIISLAPRSNDVHTLCNNEEKAPVMKRGCSVGCIACKLCEKACREALSRHYPDRDPSTIELAIQVDNFLARINYDRCIQCYQCVYVCPVPVINPLTRSKKFQDWMEQHTDGSPHQRVELPA